MIPLDEMRCVWCGGSVVIFDVHGPRCHEHRERRSWPPTPVSDDAIVVDCPTGRDERACVVVTKKG